MNINYSRLLYITVNHRGLRYIEFTHIMVKVLDTRDYIYFNLQAEYINLN